MRKFFKKIHLLLAIPTGIIISIVCFTGALMSFDELLRPLWAGWPDVYRFLMSIHRWMLDPSRTVGKLVVGICTVAFVVILISGLFIWLPRRWKKWRNHFTIKSNKGFSRFLFDSHRIIGVYTILMLLLLSLTGLMWSFEGYRNAVFSVVKVDRVPDRVAITYRTNRETGKEMRIDFNEATPERKVMRWAYLLHTGRWGGWFGPLLTGTTALLGASLPITGYVIYFRRLRRRKTNGKRKE